MCVNCRLELCGSVKWDLCSPAPLSSFTSFPIFSFSPRQNAIPIPIPITKFMLRGYTGSTHTHSDATYTRRITYIFESNRIESAILVCCIFSYLQQPRFVFCVVWSSIPSARSNEPNLIKKIGRQAYRAYVPGVPGVPTKTSERIVEKSNRLVSCVFKINMCVFVT